ncbi:MAG: hypothetical protein OXG11_00830 [Chloroflexi bacterium]|nr:hypothetical protein [Chloroflexota bacterium]
MDPKIVKAGDHFPEVHLTDLSGGPAGLSSADFEENTLLFVWASW